MTPTCRSAAMWQRWPGLHVVPLQTQRSLLLHVPGWVAMHSASLPSQPHWLLVQVKPERHQVAAPAAAWLGSTVVVRLAPGAAAVAVAVADVALGGRAACCSSNPSQSHGPCRRRCRTRRNCWGRSRGPSRTRCRRCRRSCRSLRHMRRGRRWACMACRSSPSSVVVVRARTAHAVSPQPLTPVSAATQHRGCRAPANGGAAAARELLGGAAAGRGYRWRTPMPPPDVVLLEDVEPRAATAAAVATH